MALLYRWLLASIAVLKAPNCVVKLQKQFSSSASKKHKAALQRGQVCVQPFWQYVKSEAAQREPLQMAWQKQSWTAASGGPLANGRAVWGDPESMDDGGRRPDLGTCSPVSWAGTRLESSRFHVAQ